MIVSSEGREDVIKTGPSNRFLVRNEFQLN